MGQKYDKNDFFDEMREYVRNIIDAEFRNVDIKDVLSRLYKETGGDVKAAHDELIYEVIELLGGELYDAEAEDDDEISGDSDMDDYDMDDSDY